MKAKITKAVGRYADDDTIGEVHLRGAIDTYACGLAYEDYEHVPTTKPITCTTCLTFLDWAHKVVKSKVK